ncbi:MAG: hypothetical protein WAN35_05575 [Terracidiphilus sp.]
MASNGLPNQTQLCDEQRLDLYKTIFDTWRSQVDSSWQRSSYFAAFETAAIGGCWLLIRDNSFLSVGAAIAFSFGAVLLTTVWYFSTVKTSMYVRHWWDSIIAIETKLKMNIQHYDFASQLESKPKCFPKYRYLVQAIPILFGMAWISLFTLSIVRFTCLICLKR